MSANYKGDTRWFKLYITNHKKCKCGHSVLFSKDKIICSYCGHYVFKNKKEEFVYRLEEAKRRIERGFE